MSEKIVVQCLTGNDEHARPGDPILSAAVYNVDGMSRGEILAHTGMLVFGKVDSFAQYDVFINYSIQRLSYVGYLKLKAGCLPSIMPSEAEQSATAGERTAPLLEFTDVEISKELLTRIEAISKESENKFLNEGMLSLAQTLHEWLKSRES